MARLSPFNTPIFIPHLLDRRQVRAAASSMPSGQPVPLTAMTPDAAQSTPVVPERSRRTRAMTASSLRQPSSSSDESTSLALSEHTLLPTPVDARPAFVPFQLSDEQCACSQACSRASRSESVAPLPADANIYRHPDLYGYPTLPINSVRGPKFGYIFIETRAESSRRPRLLDGLDWIPCSSANAKRRQLQVHPGTAAHHPLHPPHHSLQPSAHSASAPQARSSRPPLAAPRARPHPCAHLPTSPHLPNLAQDGSTQLVRHYCTRRTKSNAAAPATKAYVHYARTVSDEVTYEHSNPHPHPHPRPQHPHPPPAPSP